ncbi:DUF3103 family protein [Actinocrispum wychmicini]|uniref:DUF3103 family protein n=1 Tax=Actinocrispum wychmicini TaxID=1213861 RepID=A0A4R2K3L0_9PSEU|nr:DUF3103 family protein [Actinocrispum wychmicini]TCO64358.1 DUF3103 family protein [Actinocrispum wychmicini]
MRITSLRAVAVAFVLASSTVTISGTTAAAANSNTISGITDGLARALAGELTDHTVRDTLTKLAPVTPVDVRALDVRGRLGAVIDKANADLLAAKGLPAGAARLSEVRLGSPTMVNALRQGVTPLVAATPNDDNAKTFVAYAPGGKAETLPTATVPRQPVLFVDVDVKTATRLGLAVIDRETARHRKAAPALTAQGGYWATQLTSIRFKDVEEPWFKGAAEIFAVVGGFDLNGDARTDIVDMPYLDDENTTYYPNQLVIHWNRYKYNAADIVFMEDDGDTNYLQLAQALIAALAYLTDTGAYQPLVNAILQAMPGSWWTDDPDFVDACYTLTQQANDTRTCAGANGTVSVRPFWVSEL